MNMAEPPPAKRRRSRSAVPSSDARGRDKKIDLRSIDVWGLVAAVPALLVGLGVVAVVVWLRTKAAPTQWYAVEAKNRLAAQDYATAFLCYKRVDQAMAQAAKRNDPLTLQQEEVRYRMAQTLDAMATTLSARGDRESAVSTFSRALTLMRQLVPAGKPGFGPAHLWLAQKEPIVSAESFRSVESHLKAYLQVDPLSAVANQRLGQLYAKIGRLKDAERYLEAAAQKNQTALIELAAVQRALGETKASEETATRAREEFSRRAQADTDGSDLEARLLWSESALLLGDFSGAMGVLTDSLKKSDMPQYRQQIASVCVNWANTLTAASRKGAPPPPGAPRAAEILERGLSYAPTSAALYSRLLTLLEVDGDEREKEDARGVLVAIAASEKAIPEVYEGLGKDAFAHGKFDQARKYWERALELTPENARLLASLVGAYRGLGKTELAAETEQKVRNGLTRFTQSEGGPDDAQARFRYFEAAGLLGDFSAAIEVLAAGQKKNDLALYRQGIVKACTTWFDMLAQANRAGTPIPSTSPPRLEILERGLSADPTSPELIARVSAVLHGKSSEAEKAQARALLLTLTEGKKETPEVHDVLGQDAYGRQKFDEARTHWARAQALMERDPETLRRSAALRNRLAIVRNNLAWVVSHEPPIDLTRALDLANKALEVQPNQPNFHGTRGEILFKMDRFREARDDLKTAISGGDKSPEIARTMKEIEARLGASNAPAQPKS